MTHFPAQPPSELPAPDADQIKIFACRNSRAMGSSICRYLDLPLGQGHTEMFPDGEIIVKIDEDVRGRDCFVVASTHHPVNANLMELLITIDCLKRASAKRITAVIPYFGYARQDRKDEGRVPITAKLVANIITSAGANRVLTIDLHAAQIQGFFDIPVDHLLAAPVFVDYFNSMPQEMENLTLVSPDVGNVKVANMYASLLGGDLAIVDKRRKSGSEVVSANLIGDVKDRSVLMIDDMISTAGTVCEAARMVMDKGAKNIMVACTHPVLVGLAMERLQEAPISKIVVTDTIPCGERCKKIEDKMVELTVSRLLGEAIRRIHYNRSVSALFNKGTNGKR